MSKHKTNNKTKMNEEKVQPYTRMIDRGSADWTVDFV